MKYKPYENYKTSVTPWIIRIPEHWNERRLKFIATHNDEVLSEKTDPLYEIDYVDISGVNLESGINSTEAMSFEKAPSRARRLVRHGDTIISTVRTYLKAIAHIVHPPKNRVVSTGFAVIRPAQEIEEKFLSYYLQSQGFVDAIVAHSNGVSYPAINASALVCLGATYPASKSEQGHIANFLDCETQKIDLLIDKQKEMIERLQEQRTALITAAVTGQIDVRDWQAPADTKEPEADKEVA